MIARPVLLAAIALLSLGAGGTLSPVEAQERPRTLLDFLFPGRKIERVPREPDTAAPAKRAAPRASTPQARSRPAGEAVQAQPATQVEKDDDASKVIVVGDFVGAGLAEGLVQAFAQVPGIRIIDRTKGSSGLVRNDFYDWATEIGPILDEEEPAAVVVMIGSNDRQTMVVDGNREPIRSEAWTEEYSRRANALGRHFAQRGVPFIWVGQPAFRPRGMSSDMIAFNDLQRQAAEDQGGSFVDVWEGFVDEAGDFAASGPDINGQPARLRASDGINLTQAGKRKIAFYAEKPLERLLGTGGAAPLSGQGSFGPGRPESAAVINRTAPMPLLEAGADDGSELLGARPPRAPGAGRTAVEKLAIEGLAGEPRAGRVDDFSLRPPPVLPRTPDDNTSAVRQ